MRLNVRRRAKKRVTARVKSGSSIPIGPNEVWSLDFMQKPVDVHPLPAPVIDEPQQEVPLCRCAKRLPGSLRQLSVEGELDGVRGSGLIRSTPALGTFCSPAHVWCKEGGITVLSARRPSLPLTGKTCAPAESSVNRSSLA